LEGSRRSELTLHDDIATRFENCHV